MIKMDNANMDFVTKWARYTRHIDFGAVLKAHAYKHIAIYGGDGIAVLLFEYLYATDITVKCVIDINPDLDFPYETEVLTPQQFLESGIGVDAIVIATSDFWGIWEFFNPFVHCDMIDLNSFIADIDDLRSLSLIEAHLKEHGAKMYLMDMTQPLRFLKNPSTAERLKLLYKAHYKHYYKIADRANTEALYPYYDDLAECDMEYIENAFSLSPLKIIKRDGVFCLQDVQSRFYTIINGIRVTTDNPVTYDHTIHFFGDCNAVGCFAEDKYTIQSQLQRKLNTEPLHNKTYRVVNHSNWLGYAAGLRQILNTEIDENDSVVLLARDMHFGLRPYLNASHISYASVVSAFDRPHNMGEVFLDTYHLNHRGYKLLADEVYSILSASFADTKDEAKNGILRNKLLSRKGVSKSEGNTADNLSLAKYIAYLKDEAVDCTGVIGAVVMNCNPFTKGHRFLVEQASRQCDFLYIFVVEEDRSDFPFKDRLEMVRLGTSDIVNCKVIPSGKFIISTITFPEYFVKGTNNNAIIDASRDIAVFKDSIAPALHISKRFVGEEPFDFITSQYNQAMLEELPKSGISLTIIERMKSIDGYVISASKVRELLKAREFSVIATLVPKSTLDYLMNLSDANPV